jgi:predicted transcriptional regulator
MNRDRVLETVNELPQNFELDMLLEKLVFIEKIQKGLDQLNNGNTLSHEEVKKRVKSWQK